MNSFRPKNGLVVGFLCFSLALAFCLVFSISTSPLYNHYGYDSVVFQLIGKYWAEGSIPYVGFWDHKGPYIFFINRLGYLLSGDKTGVFIIQVVHLSVAFFFFYLSFRQVSQSKWIAWLFLLLTVFWLECSYDEGNLTEEYILPWIAAAVFFTLRWTKERDGKNALAIALLGGIVLGISLMTRLTSAAITCGILLYVGILFLKDKRWRELMSVVSLFLLGFFVITTPFFTYFYKKEALDAMVFGTITMNFSYASDAGGFHVPTIFRNIIVMSAPFLSLVGLTIFQSIKERRFRSDATLWLFATVPYFLWLLTSKCFTHYTMVTIPLIPAFVMLLFRLFETSLARTSKIVVALFFLFGIVLSGVSLRHNLKAFDYAYCKEAAWLLQETIPDTETDSFVAWEYHPGIYLETQMKPHYSHFFAQEWHASFSEDVGRDILREFSSLQARWLLVSPQRAGRIQDILDRHYVKVASSAVGNDAMHSFSVYQLKSR